MANPQFDADSFLNQNLDGPLAEEADLVPPDEYEATIIKVDARKPKDNETGINLILQWEIQSDALRAEMGRPKITVPQFMFVELDDNGRIAKGGDKNWRLGQVKAAVGQNSNGPWNPKMLEGAGPAMIRVKHNEYQGNVSAQVDRVVALS